MVDFDPDVVKRLTHKGIPVRYGDAEDNEFLDDLDLEHVKTVVSTLPDIEVNLFVLGKTRRKNKKALFIATAQGVEEANELYAHGADYVVLPHYLGGNHAALLLDRFGHDPANFAAERAKHVAYLATRRDA